MNEKARIVFRIIICIVMLCSFAANIFFIRSDIHNSRQAKLSSKRLESELSDAASLSSSAAESIKRGNDKIGIVSEGLRSSSKTAGTIKDNAESSVSKCGDITETIITLREQIENLETCCDNSSSNCSCVDSSAYNSVNK